MNITDYSKVTFIDAYYKGFHAGITERGEGTASAVQFELQAREVREAIDKMIALGFEPSWNKQTSNEALNGKTPTTTPPVTPNTAVSSAFSQSAPNMPDVTPVSLGVCKKCQAPNIIYKSGTVGCSRYCWRK